jgi:uracil-DNA glycosylase family 4
LNERELLQEYRRRAEAVQLQCDCLMSGRLDSELAIISEAPGEREAIMGMPLVGGSGQKLWKSLGRYDINRTGAYISNVIKRQLVLSGKEKAKRPLPRPELEHWQGLLDWELDQLPNLKVILCLGNVALESIVGVEGITNWRGSVVHCKVGLSRRDVTVVCAYNPAHILREPKLDLTFDFDMYKLDLVLNDKWVPYKIKPHINPTMDEIHDYITRLIKDGKPVAFDIEAIGGQTACIGLTDDEHSGMCINFRSTEGSSRFDPGEERQVRLWIQELFDSDNEFVAQNGNFDSYWLHFKDRIGVRCGFDTLLAHHTLYPRMPHNLGFLTAQYTTHPYYKDEGYMWREWFTGQDIDNFWEYNVKDVCITLCCSRKLKEELKRAELEEFFYGHVMRLQPHLTLMTVLGIKADEEYIAGLATALGEDVDRCKEQFNKAVERATGTPCDVNPASPRQVGNLLFEQLRLTGRGRSTGKENLGRIRKHPSTRAEDIEVISKLDSYRKEAKFKSTYVDFKLDDDGRIRCEYRQFGTQSAPGRLSSAQTMWGSGMNLQNQPIRAYPMFIADQGYEFTYFDLAQAEAKVVAWMWNVEGLKDAFVAAEDDTDVDVHRINGARIFRKQYNDIPTKDRNEDGSHSLRYIAKRCVHGLNYRMMPDKLATVTGLPFNEALEAHASYHRAFPEIRKGWEETVREVKNTKMLWNFLGRRLLFLEPLTEEAMEAIIAFRPQSTIGDLINRVIYQCHEDPEWPEDARIKMNIHDALVAMNKRKDRKKVVEVMKRHAEEPLLIRGEQVVIFAEFKHSVPDEKGMHRWSSLTT